MKIEVHTVRALWAPRFWRHPILWWKTRPIRKLVKAENEPNPLLSPEGQALVREMEIEAERRFIFGDDAPTS